MESVQAPSPRFPIDLLEWAGNRSGGVKRLFDVGSGRPAGELLKTNLISRLEAWAENVAAGKPDTPRLLLLVGGPGNGKTEAIEHTINCLDKALGANGSLVQRLSELFRPAIGQAVPRLVEVDAGSVVSTPGQMVISIVQDSSATAGHEGQTAPELLVEEILAFLTGPSAGYYLCCVNRGILDDALIHALDNDFDKASNLLEAITRSVSLSATAPSCWPLAGFADVAIWPMDAESLLVSPGGELPSPASTLLAHATNPAHWPVLGKCPAGDDCPLCNSNALLGRDETRLALLRILRWYELASGKRWSFRDLFSLVSYLLAGHRPAGQREQGDSCQWAAHLIDLDKAGEQSGNPRREHLTAAFQLATASYQHSLFHRWDVGAATALRQGIKELGLVKEVNEARVLIGLQYFLQDRRSSYLPATIASVLENIVDLLDPAMASPDLEVAVSGRTKVLLGEIDTRFSRSIAGGVEFLRRFQVLAKAELDLLRRLGRADEMLSSPLIRRKNPVSATRLQRILRDFACRLVRRSICTRSAIVADVQILGAFQQVVEDDVRGQRLFEVARQVKNLLNSGQNFEVSLTTTFGQPLPPTQRQATLVVPARQVKMGRVSTEGRPRSPISFLEIGSGQSVQPIALTYDLFKAVEELRRGLSPASLPRTVVALLDTTKARLSGPIVRDPEAISEARIKIGAEGTEIGTSWDGSFVSLEGAAR